MTSTSTAERSGAASNSAPVLDSRVMELLASRMCHDLISPVGAVHNGVEFLQEMGLEAGEEAVSLIAHSAGQAAARLQIFRIMYGAGGRDSNIKPADLKKLFGDLVDADGKVKQDWDPHSLSHTERPVGFCKLLLGCMMLAQESLPKGGTIRIETTGTGPVTVTAEGTDAALRPHVPEALTRNLDVDSLDPRLVHAYVLSVLGAQYGYTVSPGKQDRDRAVFVLTAA